MADKAWQKRVGYFDAGVCSIDIVARSGYGGEFYSQPESGSVPRIKVGMDYNTFGDVVDILCHELMEFLLTIRGHRWVMAPDLSMDMGGFSFHMTHAELSECARGMGVVLCAALGPLRKVYAARVKQLNKENKLR